MGGVGKTTLARLVYNGQKVEDFFEQRVWVCLGMSEKLDRRQVAISILESIGSKEKSDFQTLEALVKALKNEISKKQPFLIVFDDASDADPAAWEAMLEPLRACRSRGNSIIVTTRDRRVADAACSGSFEPVDMGPLDGKAMWCIFKRSSLLQEEESSGHRRLEVIGRQIVQRLGGLPLAAKVIGSMLKRSRDESYWRRILNTLPHLMAQENSIMPILVLSYYSLPANLRCCFAYLSLLPKDYKLYHGLYFQDGVYTRIDMVRHWIALDFFQFGNETKLEDIVAESFGELLNKSVLQMVSRDKYSFSVMHDLLHDLAEKISRDECFRVSDDDTVDRLPENLRHVSFFGRKESSNMLCKLAEHKTLRSLLVSNDNIVINNGLLDSWFKKLRCLRILCLQNYHLRSLPESIGELVLLRVLDLHLPKLESLPETISCLRNLQVLKINWCCILRSLPETISCLRNLQVLKINWCHILRVLSNSIAELTNLIDLDLGNSWGLLHTINGIGRLTNLRQLREFRVQRQEGHRIEELEKMDRLCGSLRIRNLENIEGKTEAKKAQLDKKNSLEELQLVWETNKQEVTQSDNVLEGLRPCDNLKKLVLVGYSGMHLPKWLRGGHLRFLEDIEFRSCERVDRIPSLDNLRKLKLIDCPMVRNFPYLANLRELLIRDCTGLENILVLPLRLQSLILIHAGVTSILLEHQGIGANLHNLPPSSASSSVSTPSLLESKEKSMPSIFSVSSSLKKLEIKWCRNLDESLNMLLQLSPLLESVEITSYRHSLKFLSCQTALVKLKLNYLSGSVTLNLANFISLEELEIKQSPNATVTVIATDFEPCSCLHSLFVSGNPNFPRSLFESGVALTSLTKLVIDSDSSIDDLVLSRCLSGLTALRELEIENCPNITSMSEEALCKLLALRELRISNCKGIKKLHWQALASLESLHIDDCPNLMFDEQPQRVLEGMYISNFSSNQLAGLFSSIQRNPPKYLSLRSCTISNGIVGFGLEKFSEAITLETLSISSCTGPPLPFPALNFFKILHLIDCPNITSLPVLRFLKELDIRKCSNLVLGEASLFPSLESLSTSEINLRQLTDIIIQVVQSPLRVLYIWNCEELECFEGKLKSAFLSLASLQELHLMYCPKLLLLPPDLRVFKELVSLQIHNCSEMLTLPEHLPTSLKELDISDCPKLEEKYLYKEGNRHPLATFR